MILSAHVRVFVLKHNIRRRQGVTPTESTYTSCIGACQREGKWFEAVQLLQQMQVDYNHATGTAHVSSTPTMHAQAFALHACYVNPNRVCTPFAGVLPICCSHLLAGYLWILIVTVCPPLFYCVFVFAVTECGSFAA